MMKMLGIVPKCSCGNILWDFDVEEHVIANCKNCGIVEFSIGDN